MCVCESEGRRAETGKDANRRKEDGGVIKEQENKPTKAVGGEQSRESFRGKKKKKDVNSYNTSPDQDMVSHLE